MCCDVRLGLIVTVLLYTGMRVGIEALRIKWTDVDFEDAVITVAQSKTAAGLRALPMTKFVASELQKWHASTRGISEYVFSTRNARVYIYKALRLLGTML
jgi:integrase